jgi:hypothetical protein
MDARDGSRVAYGAQRRARLVREGEEALSEWRAEGSQPRHAIAFKRYSYQNGTPHGATRVPFFGGISDSSSVIPSVFRMRVAVAAALAVQHWECGGQAVNSLSPSIMSESLTFITLCQRGEEEEGVGGRPRGTRMSSASQRQRQGGDGVDQLGAQAALQAWQKCWQAGLLGQLIVR